ncbi:MAG: GDSL-type esterase/lipase family protein [Gammaproteobacteria bacterium]|nr:GDSL-type esterase/lipase family protein [Gammaproteobacteria bacterium]
MKIRWPVFALLLCALASPVSARVLLVFGDSLSTAFGMDETQGWVHLLGERLQDKYPGMHILNESVNGETTKGGLKRLPKVLEEHTPQIVILELGANDGLRFTRIQRIRENLEAMIHMIQRHGAQVVLAGVRLPDYYRARYRAAFFENYAHIAKEHGLVHIPNLLEGVSKIEDGFLFDGLHPSAAAQPHILENVWPDLSALLQCTMARAHEHSECSDWNCRYFFERANEAQVRACLRIGADPRASDDAGRTPLHWAAGHNENPEILRTLIGAGATVDLQDHLGATPLHWTTYHPTNPAMAEELMRATSP